MSARFYFDSFEVDVKRGDLRKEQTKVYLPHQSFVVLTCLLRNAGDIVSREELYKNVWPSNTFVDFDHGLNAVINRLRKALGDTAAVPIYIETVPRRGYRFIGRLGDRECRDASHETTAASVKNLVRRQRQSLWRLLQQFLPSDPRPEQVGSGRVTDVLNFKGSLRNK
jgi:DNA-binding winged helix-turn-helix (wHTH) protein